MSFWVLLRIFISPLTLSPALCSPTVSPLSIRALSTAIAVQLLRCALRWILVVSCGERAREGRLGCCGTRACLLCGMWDLSSPARSRTCVPCTERWILNHWTTRKGLTFLLLTIRLYVLNVYSGLNNHNSYKVTDQIRYLHINKTFHIK